MDLLQASVLRAKFAKHTPSVVHEPPRIVREEPPTFPVSPTPENKTVEVPDSELAALTRRFDDLQSKVAKIMHIVGMRDDRPLTGPKYVLLADIRHAVKEHFGVTDTDLDQPTKGHAIIYTARQVAFYLCRKLTSRSWPSIGHAFQRDHSSAMHGADKIRSRLTTDENMAADVAKIEAQLAEVLKRRQEAAAAE